VVAAVPSGPSLTSEAYVPRPQTRFRPRFQNDASSINRVRSIAIDGTRLSAWRRPFSFWWATERPPRPAVHQVLATLGYGDAIGHEVLGIQRVSDRSVLSDIFVGPSTHGLSR
jgi:hypothetical protein